MILNSVLKVVLIQIIHIFISKYYKIFIVLSFNFIVTIILSLEHKKPIAVAMGLG